MNAEFNTPIMVNGTGERMRETVMVSPPSPEVRPTQQLQDYLQIIWQRKWVVIGVPLIAALVAGLISFLIQPTYQATSVVRILTSRVGDINDIRYDISYADRLMNTYSNVATSGPVIDELMTRLQLAEKPAIEIKILANTELMEITAEHEDARTAKAIANTLGDILVEESQRLLSGSSQSAADIIKTQLDAAETDLNVARSEYEALRIQSEPDAQQLDILQNTVEVKQATYDSLLDQYDLSRLREAVRSNEASVTDPAQLPLEPAKPRRVLIIGLGLVLGVVAGLGLAFLLDSLDSRLYTTSQIEEEFSLTTLAKIPNVPQAKKLGTSMGETAAGEALRRLRTYLFSIEGEQPWQTLMITSAEPGEGKSTVIANLAALVAQSGRTVVVVDADLRRPVQHTLFKLQNSVGLSNVLKQEISLAEAIQPSAVFGVKVLTSGSIVDNYAEWLGSARMSNLLDDLKQQFDVIMLDSPAFLAVTDAAVLARQVDSVLLVVRRGKARADAVRQTCQELTMVKARLLGMIVNRTEPNHNYRYYAAKSRTA